MSDINDLDKLDEMLPVDFDYMIWWDNELQNCFSDNDLNDLYEVHRDNIDENMMQLFKQRQEEINGNPVERIRNGELLKMRGTGGVYNAIQILANRND